MGLEQLGAAVVSVDLASLGGRSPSGSEPQDTILTRLLELFDLYEVAATWALAEPAADEAVPKILAADPSHEIALLGGEEWVGDAAGRPQFARELARRTSAAREMGLSLRTLACRSARVSRDHHDLLFKHGIVVVRQARPGVRQGLADLQPQTLRHGVWEAPATAELPRLDAWWGAGVGAARASLRKAEASHRVAHVTLDLAQLKTADPRLQAVENVLRRLARAKGRGMLRAAVLGDLADEWSRCTPSRSAGSILRAA